jgi:hypothetical protein
MVVEFFSKSCGYPPDDSSWMMKPAVGHGKLLEAKLYNSLYLCGIELSFGIS